MIIYKTKIGYAILNKYSIMFNTLKKINIGIEYKNCIIVSEKNYNQYLKKIFSKHNFIIKRCFKIFYVKSKKLKNDLKIFKLDYNMSNYLNLRTKYYIKNARILDLNLYSEKFAIINKHLSIKYKKNIPKRIKVDNNKYYYKENEPNDFYKTFEYLLSLHKFIIEL